MRKLLSSIVVINEIAWMGSPIDGVQERQWWRYEWLELYNPAEVSVRLDGWKIGLYREELDFEIPLSGTIEAQGYFLIAASNQVPEADVDYASLAGKFANAGQRVALKNAAGVVIEEIDASGGWFAGDNDTKTTMERRFLEREANDPENWGSSQKTGGTPKEQNSLFGKAKFVPLASPDISAFPQQKTRWVVFMRALLGAVLGAAGILGLRQYLTRAEQDEGSFDARRG